MEKGFCSPYVACVHNQCQCKPGFKDKGRLQNRFRPVSIVLNNDNRQEPDGTAGQPAVGF